MTELSNEAEFYRFMESNGPNSDGGKRNYISWLRYVNELYRPKFSSLASDNVETIYQQLKQTQASREIYTSDSSVSDIKSALNKYVAFVSSDNSSVEIADDIYSLVPPVDTKVKREIECRLGQGQYRTKLIEIWGKCSVTEFERVDLLVASHIKPWSLSTPSERVDPFNGLLLTPNLDKLFDRGYISFKNSGEIIISRLLTESDLMRLNISKSLHLYKIESNINCYLEFHRKEMLL